MILPAQYQVGTPRHGRFVRSRLPAALLRNCSGRGPCVNLARGGWPPGAHLRHMRRAMRFLKVLAKVLAVLIVLFGLIQLIPYGRTHANPRTTMEPTWDSPRTRELAKRACFDCHSNETRWP